MTYLPIMIGLTMAVSCLVVGWSQHRIGPLWDDLLKLVSGSATEITWRDAPLSTIIADGMATAVLTVPVMLFGLGLAALFGGLQKTFYDRTPIFPLKAGKNAPRGAIALIIAIHKMAGIVLLEEFYARWLFLGFLAKLSWFEGPYWLYGFFIVGNTLWAVIHITNYRKGERHVSVTLPVFCYGFISAVMFLRYGLLGAFTCHIIWDCLLMVPVWIGQTLRKLPLTF
jgi:hypothetical protein